MKRLVPSWVWMAALGYLGYSGARGSCEDRKADAVRASSALDRCVKAAVREE